MGKAKRCILAICVAVLLVGAGTIIYRQAQGSESLWGTFVKDHKDLVKKYSDWFNKDGEFYFKIAEGKKDTAWWDKIFDKVANKEEGTKIPEELIKAMTTEQLLDACARHPLAFRFYADQEHAYLDWDTYVKKEFNGIESTVKIPLELVAMSDTYVCVEAPNRTFHAYKKDIFEIRASLAED